MMASKQQRHTISKSLKECPVMEVTVYKDKALVHRLLEVDLEEGEQEVIVTDFQNVDEFSLRVKRESEDVSISEARFRRQRFDGVLQKRLDELVNERDARNEKKDSLFTGRKTEMIDAELEMVDKFFARAATAGVAGDEKDTANVVLTDSYLSAVDKYMKKYRDLKYSIVEHATTLKNDSEKMEAFEEELSPQIQEIIQRKRAIEKKLWETFLVLDSPKQTKAKLVISYIVSEGVSWVPSYDFHLSTKDFSLKVSYYGVVTQLCGENWNNAKISFSTARPINSDGSFANVARSVFFPNSRNRADDIDLYKPEYWNEYSRDPRPAKPIDQSSSVTYKAMESVPSNDLPHKVKIAVLDVPVNVSYLTVPRVSPCAALRAKFTNRSEYVLLAGLGHCFLDGNFVNQINLPTVARMEEYEFPLGVDPHLLVTYNGLVKTKSSSDSVDRKKDLYEQVVEVNNQHARDVKILVQEFVPYVQEEDGDDIQVTLVSPELDSTDPLDVRRIGDDKIEWTLTIAPKTTQNVAMKYYVEQSSNANV